MSVWRSYPSKLQLNEYVLIGVDVLLHFGIMWCLHELGLNVAQAASVIKGGRYPLFFSIRDYVAWH